MVDQLNACGGRSARVARPTKSVPKANWAVRRKEGRRRRVEGPHRLGELHGRETLRAGEKT